MYIIMTVACLLQLPARQQLGLLDRRLVSGTNTCY
jgi:hypothetical protein